MQKCKDDDLQREFYILMTKKFGWTKNVLIHQIDNKTYEKYLLNQTNFDETIDDKYKKQAILAIKDDHQFDFLELGDQHSEYELETAILKNIQPFLLEMGGYFAFIGTYTIQTELPDKWQTLLPSPAQIKKQKHGYG